MGNNEMLLGVYGAWHIVTDHPAASATCGHRPRIGIGQRDLLVLGLHHLSVQSVQALYLLAQRRNLLVEPGDFGFRYCFPLASAAVDLREVAGSASRRCILACVKFRSRVHGLELAAVDRNARFAARLHPIEVSVAGAK